MSSKVLSATVVGLDAELIEVEADVTPGLASFSIVGLPDTAVQEARERVRSAIKNSGVLFPRSRVTVNLAPADLKKEGTSFDLPIAIATLLASEELRLGFGPAINGSTGELNGSTAKTALTSQKQPWQTMAFIGELALDGCLRPTSGVLSIALKIRRAQIPFLFVPKANAAEAALVSGLKVIPVQNLAELISHLRGIELIAPAPETALVAEKDNEDVIDMAFIAGQEHAKRALEIAAAGGHNVLLTGPPGSGKTLLARAMAGVLPVMNFEEMLEVTRIYSVVGLLLPNQPVIQSRPFRSPHHTASSAAIIGGGTTPKPGEITLAHRGVLFLDEAVEFHRDVLEGLREPMESGTVTVARAGGTVRFPASFMLVAARNPCPCGYAGDPKHPCTCSAGAVIKYQKRISGPLLDRIDLVVEVPRLKFEKLTEERVAESSSEIRKRIEAARQKQLKRFAQTRVKTNSQMNVTEIKNVCRVDGPTQELLRQAVEKLHLSARAYHRILKLGRTIADLADSEHITTQHIAEALQYRPKVEL